MANLGIEARRSPRRVFNRAIGLLCGGEYELAQSLQISEGGMAIAIDHSLPERANLVITLHIQAVAGLVLRAKVVNERSKVGQMHIYGIQFAGLDLHQRRLIRAYVSAKTQAEAEAED